MRMRWRGFELPTHVTAERETLTSLYGKFIAEPFERGFGTTVGNSLRRVLLSSIEGGGVTTVRIEGVQHQYSTIKGVVEDVTDIILNIKQVRLRLHSEGPKILKIDRRSRGEVTAGDIQADPDVEVVNPELHIATLTEDVSFAIEMGARRGRGYATAEDNTKPEQEIGVIPVDTLFSPVRRVSYRAEDTRVGQKTNYDRLVMEIWTNGTITPEMAMVEAGKILRKHLNPFVQYFELGEQIVESRITEAQQEVDTELQRRLEMPVQELELSVRANNCLEAAKIENVGQLISMNEAELLKIRSFGKTSLREVKRKLEDLDLSLGMKVPIAGSQGSREEGGL